MTNENFFKHDNKAYTENLNDAILIANAFNYQVPVNIPGMYNNNHYPNDNNIHKVGVADVTIVSSGSLSIGDTSITNNSNTSQVLRLRVYPNFNSFYAWKKLNWTCTGDVTVNICDAGTSTSLLPSGALTNPDNETLLNGISSLQGLKEYDLLITIPVSGVLNTLSLVFVNNWNSNNRVSASISQANVTGLEDELSSLQTEVLPTLITPETTTYLKNNQLYYSKKGNICMVDGTYELNSVGALKGLRVGFLPNSFKPVRPVKNVLYWGDGYTVKCSIIIEDGKPLLYFETEGFNSIPKETALYVHIVWLCESESV